jgi:hypothetical protein
MVNEEFEYSTVPESEIVVGAEVESPTGAHSKEGLQHSHSTSLVS